MCVFIYEFIYLFIHTKVRGIFEWKMYVLVCDALVRVNAAANFFLYSAFGRQFRDTLLSMCACARKGATSSGVSTNDGIRSGDTRDSKSSLTVSTVSLHC